MTFYSHNDFLVSYSRPLDVDAVFRDTLDVDLQSTLFISQRSHIGYETFSANAINIMEHESKGIVWFVGWGLLAFPLVERGSPVFFWSCYWLKW